MLIKNRLKTIKTTRKVFDILDSYEPNTLKEKDGRDVTKIKASLIKKGFRFPVFIWEKYILDGAGRYQAIKELISEGHEFEDIPVIEVEAESKKEAMELAMIISSKNGDITKKSFNEFLFGLDAGEFDFSIINIGLDKKDLIAFNESDLEEQSDLGNLREADFRDILKQIKRYLKQHSELTLEDIIEKIKAEYENKS
jgi:hypothetical protein